MPNVVISNWTHQITKIKLLKKLHFASYSKIGCCRKVPQIFSGGNTKSPTVFTWDELEDDSPAFHPHQWSDYSVTPRALTWRSARSTRSDSAFCYSFAVVGTVASQEGSKFRSQYSVWTVHGFLMPAWVSSRFCSSDQDTGWDLELVLGHSSWPLDGLNAEYQRHRVIYCMICDKNVDSSY